MLIYATHTNVLFLPFQTYIYIIIGIVSNNDVILVTYAKFFYSQPVYVGFLAAIYAFLGKMTKHSFLPL